MKVNEIFVSIQGEGTRAGLPCTFVRFTACNLRCTYCDTAYAFYDGTVMPRAEVLARVHQLGVPLVCVTGGEPMLQREIIPFLQQLLVGKHTVVLETGGQQSLVNVPSSIIKIVDIKTPGAIRNDPDHEWAVSEQFLAHHFDYSNLNAINLHDELKIVITGRFDYEWAKAFIREHHLTERVAAVMLSPCHGKVHPSVLSSWMLEDRLPVRLNLQLHKYIWGDDARGV